MDEDPRIATSYEVLLYADIGTRLGIERRWLIAGSYASRLAATAQYEELNREFPHPKVRLVLVASVHDAASGLFRDRVLEARGAVPLIEQKKMRRLEREDRARLAAALSPPVPLPRPVRPEAARPAGNDTAALILGLVLLAGAGLAVLLR